MECVCVYVVLFVEMHFEYMNGILQLCKGYINHASLYVIVLFPDLHAPAQLDVEDLHGDVEDLHGDVEDLHGDVEDLHVDVEDLHVDVEDLHVDVEDLHVDVEDLHAGTWRICM